MNRPLYLAAGTILGASPREAIDAAAAAGFDGLGLRLDASVVTDHEVAAIRRQLDASGLSLFDLEVIRLNDHVLPGPDRRLVEIAAELGATWVVTVSMLASCVVVLGELCDLAASHGVRVALEFMRFTSVGTLAEARDLVRAVERPNLALLVDALHVSRSADLDALAALDPAMLAYAQLCDALAVGPSTPAELAEEARHHRLMPGYGELDLTAFVAALPAELAASVEVQSDALAATTDIVGRARLAYAAAIPLLAP